VKYLSPEELSKELRYFPALLFQVLALALQFLPSAAAVWKRLPTNDIALCRRYSDIGVELMVILGRPGVALTAVQADFLRTSWLKNIGRGVEAWHSIGNAIRSVYLRNYPVQNLQSNIGRHKNSGCTGKKKFVNKAQTA